MPGPEEVIPVVGVIAATVIPITIILTRHQQKMTMLLRQNSMSPPEIVHSHTSSDMANIHHEVQQLKSMVSSLAITVDNLKDEIHSGSQIQERVKIGE